MWIVMESFDIQKFCDADINKKIRICRIRISITVNMENSPFDYLVSNSNILKFQEFMCLSIDA